MRHRSTETSLCTRALVRIFGFAPLMLASALAAPARGDTITLKSAVRLHGEGGVITLNDVATLEGEEALRLSSVQVASIKPASAGRPLEVSVADVRRALDAAGANWAKINLSGRSVLVRPARDASSLPPQAMAPLAIDAGRSQAGAVAPAPRVDDDHQSLTLEGVMQEQTIRGSIARLIIANLRVDPTCVRVRLDADDQALLSTPLSSSRYEIQPLGSLASDRLAFAVRSWSGNQSQSSGQVSMTVERLTQLTRAKRELSRDVVLNDDDVETVAQWIAPSEAMQAAARAAVIGRTLGRSLKSGDIVRSRDVQRETVIKRGDQVIVRCLVGGVAISLQAEARGEGAEGDIIEFRKPGERESFLATISGKGEAVVDLSRNDLHKRDAQERSK
jgi:flagella basal body P-ring formation protein FlgA